MCLQLLFPQLHSRQLHTANGCIAFAVFFKFFQHHTNIGNGGAVFAAGILRLHSCLLTNNTAELNGGAVFLDFGGSEYIKNTVMTGNTAKQSGR
jgi:hypothetical protein